MEKQTVTEKLTYEEKQRIREKEIYDANIQQLEKEVRLLELTSLPLEALFAKVKRCKGECFSLSFEARVRTTPVKGRVFFAPNPFTGVYGINYYEIKVSASLGFVRDEQIFPCEPWLTLRLDEAVNLMQGRHVYRKPEIGAGYWLALKQSAAIPSAATAIDGFTFLRNGFDVREYLAETGLGGWLGLNGWIRLVDELERGHRCELTLGEGPEKRTVKVETDPLARRLTLRDRRGNEVNPQ